MRLSHLLSRLWRKIQSFKCTYLEFLWYNNYPISKFLKVEQICFAHKAGLYADLLKSLIYNRWHRIYIICVPRPNLPLPSIGAYYFKTWQINILKRPTIENDSQWQVSSRIAYRANILSVCIFYYIICFASPISDVAISENSHISPKTTSAQKTKDAHSRKPSFLLYHSWNHFFVINSAPSPMTPINTSRVPGCLAAKSAIQEKAEKMHMDESIDKANRYILIVALVILAVIKIAGHILKK